MVIFGVFSARTSAFIGMRLECYVIARNKTSGLMSWIIVDYETNTNSHDPKNGFCGYSCDPAVYSVTPYGELLVDVQGSAADRLFSLRADLKAGAMEGLDEALWVEGNMSVDYGGVLKSGSSAPFSLIFDTVLMKEAKRIPLKKVSLEGNSFLPDIIDADKPDSAAVFPYSQHYIIRQDLEGQVLTGKKELQHQTQEFLKRTGFKTMKGDDIKMPLFRGMLVTSIVNIGLIVFLLIKLLSRG